MSRWSDLSEVVEALAERIAGCEEQELVDGSLSGTEVGAILIFDEACREERLVLRLEELVSEFLDERSLEFLDEGEIAAVLREWCLLFRRLADRIEATAKSVAV